jgi:hypothetical protein
MRAVSDMPPSEKETQCARVVSELPTWELFEAWSWSADERTLIPLVHARVTMPLWVKTKQDVSGWRGSGLSC